MEVRRLLDPVAPPLCFGCRGPARPEPLCVECRQALRWLGPEPVMVAGVETWAPLAYEGPARALVRALKYRGALRIADTMAAQIAAIAPAGLFDAAVLVSVPLHPARERARGLDQARALALALMRRTRLPFLSEALHRRGPARSQVGQNREERLAGLGGTIQPATEISVPVLLVDDVITTGATVAACAEALSAAGSPGIRAVAYARTPAR